MEPSREERRAAERMNKILWQELGNPPYSWQWSEDLTLQMQDINKPWEYVANGETGLIEPRPQYIERRVCFPSIVDRWVICRHSTCSREEWEAQFGKKMPWPENGKWIPCDNDEGYIALNFGQFPDKVYTDIVIRRVRAHRDVSDSDALESMLKRAMKHEKASEEKRRDMIDDEVPKLLSKPQNVIYSLGSGEHKQIEVKQ